DFRAQRRHEIGVTLKKTYVLVVRDRYQRVDLDGEIAPIFEEQSDRRDRQLAFKEFTHEGAVGHALFPTPQHFMIQTVDVTLGVGGIHFYAEFGADLVHRFCLVNKHPSRGWLKFLAFSGEARLFEGSGISGPVKIIDEAAVIDAPQIVKIP